jgi:hypothetical protein
MIPARLSRYEGIRQVAAGTRGSRVEKSVLLIGVEVLPGKISVKGGACAIASAMLWFKTGRPGHESRPMGVKCGCQPPFVDLGRRRFAWWS